MSGGIDSTVSAMLLMEQGYEIIGCTFRSYDGKAHGVVEKKCCAETTILAAQQLAKKLGFEHHVVDFRDLFHCHVVQNFVTEYLSGRTPNPCVMCNSHIKWGEMMRMADQLQCDHIATGHYAQIRECDGHLYLANAADIQKDQTYFLWMLTEENIRRTIFPLGGLTKSEVREIARQHGYESLAQKAESQEICFVTDDDYRSFLRANVPEYNERVREGNYINQHGQVLGKHMGFVNYTIGQRKGLGIALGHPAYVTHIDADTNRITLGTNEDMYASHLCFQIKTPLRPFRSDKPLTAKIRYRTTPVEAQLQVDNQQKTGEVCFSSPVWGITPGQSIVIYQDGLVIGGGIIQ